MTQAFNLALLANNVNSSGQLNADSGLYNTVNIANGGTNLSATPTNGQLLIGNGTGYTLATLTASTGISVTNASGSITLTNTQPNATVDIQTFNAGDADLVWDKPTTGQTMVRIQVWGGGGGGGRAAATAGGSGGGGGAYNEIVVPISYVDTQTVTVGAAGVGRTGSAGAGTAGGFSSFAINATGQAAGIRATITAYGGGGGGSASNLPGMGGGQLSAGSTSIGAGGNTVGGQPIMITGVDMDSIGAAYALSFGGHAQQGQGSISGGQWHGGCGAGQQSGYGTSNLSAPGCSVWGGGGGFGSNIGAYPGYGISMYGGNGGYRAAGSTPAGGGGGGYGNGINGYNGGAGRIIITSW